MALLICESVSKEGTFNSTNIFARYLSWFFNKEDGYDDTGLVAINAFQEAMHTLVDPKQTTFDVSSIEEKLSIETIAAISKSTHDNLDGYTAGVNGSHRGCVLSMFSAFNVDQLLNLAKMETTMTHCHPLAYQTTQISVLLCRLLMLQGANTKSSWWQELSSEISNHINPLEDQLQSALCDILGSDDDFEETLNCFPTNNKSKQIKRDGFSPHVLRASLFFLRKHTSKKALEYTNHDEIVKNCLEDSFLFAGKANYCPVLLGAFLGSMFGSAAIEPHITNCQCLDRVRIVANKISNTW
ncbi:mediator of RNA polymerase II transcription subunit 23 [Acrasis kona]|uniref:Mediator of RNA polymerase II transcription subunit 23 n=1 Tax=Acrasis kona TaxID=1008807 RepID=A0AAW2YW27_9EUKA